ncbi:MAG: recombinase zinc beta ribbon domain-containing protein [Chloroflexi bacterium]|nr:recombinase zinc beta ribbon domain-containing protein [Chloroflexota bacterium]
MLNDLHGRFRRINDRYKREKLAREHPFGVIFWKSNRLGRDAIEATNIKSDLRLRGITVVDLITAATTGIMAVDSIIEAVQTTHDEMILEDISTSAKRGLAQLVGLRDTDETFLSHNPDWQPTGGYLGLMPGGVPTGFKGERVQIGVYERKKGRQSGEPRIVQRIVPDPETWERCRQAWEMRTQGSTIGEIHRTTRLFRTINSYDTFFANRIYTGDLVYGGKLYENFVPALIPKAWYEDVQKHRAQRATKMQGRALSSVDEPGSVGSAYLLSGLVVCGVKEDEEHPMHIESIPGKKGKRGNYVYFICTTRKNTRKGACQARRISMRALERTVLDLLVEHILTADNLRPLVREIRDALMSQSGEANTRVAAIEAQLHEVRKAIDNVIDSLEKMGYAPELQRRYDVRRQEEETLLHELASLKAVRGKPGQTAKLNDEVVDEWIGHIRSALQGEDKQVARRALHQFVAKIVIKQKTGMLYYTFPLPDELYMPSFRNLDLRGFEPLTSTVRL